MAKRLLAKCDNDPELAMAVIDEAFRAKPDIADIAYIMGKWLPDLLIKARRHLTLKRKREAALSLRTTQRQITESNITDHTLPIPDDGDPHGR